MQKISIPLKEKKVLFVTSTFPLNENDIQVPWMVELIKRLSGKFKIDVLAPSYKGLKSSKFLGINIFRFRYAPAFLETLTHNAGALFRLQNKPWLLVVAFLYVIFGIFAIFFRSKKEKYDVIHVHWPLPQGLFGIIGKMTNTNTKIIMTFYGAEFTLANKLPFGNKLLSFLIHRADSIIAISTFTKEKIQEISKVDVEIIPFSSAILPSKIYVKKQETTIKHILFVGRLIERKGVAYLIDAINKLSSNVVLDIAGEGPLYATLKIKIDSLGLNKRIFLHGRVSNEELKKLYENCDVFVLPSITDKWGDTEGLGVVILEAMSFGKPVIGTSVGGITDIIKDGKNGLLVPQKNSMQLANAIKRVLRDNKLENYLSNNGINTVKHSFSWQSIIDAIEKIYD